MNVKKDTLIQEQPDAMDIDEVMYRLTLLQRIEAAESSVKKRQTVSHVEAMMGCRRNR